MVSAHDTSSPSLRPGSSPPRRSASTAASTTATAATAGAAARVELAPEEAPVAVRSDAVTATGTNTGTDIDANKASAGTGVTPLLPALPAPPAGGEASGDSNGTTVVEVNGAAVMLDNLGPMVVGRDGMLSRIANWGEMTAIERDNTLRILCKRNQLRLANLRGQDGAKQT